MSAPRNPETSSHTSPSFFSTIRTRFTIMYGTALTKTTFGQHHVPFTKGLVEGGFIIATLTHPIERITDHCRMQKGATPTESFNAFLKHPFKGYFFRSFKSTLQLSTIYSTKSFFYDGLESIYSSSYNEHLSYGIGASFARVLVNPLNTFWFMAHLKENEKKSHLEILKKMSSTVTIKDLFTRGVPTVIARDFVAFPSFLILKNLIMPYLATESVELKAGAAGIFAMLLLSPFNIPTSLVGDLQKAKNISAKEACKQLYREGGVFGFFRSGKLCLLNSVVLGGALGFAKQLTKDAKEEAAKTLKK